MSTTKDIAGIIPGVMSVALVGESLKMLPKEMKGKKMNSKPFAMKPMKSNNKKLIKGFTNITVGTALLGATSGMVNKL